MEKRLVRPHAGRQLAGVCVGLADYFNVDPTIVRLIFVLATLAGGPGLLLYIILALVMPEGS
jgi:phage shock protein C